MPNIHNEMKVYIRYLPLHYVFEAGGRHLKSQAVGILSIKVPPLLIGDRLVI